jgi:translation elongation factor EF-Ts
MDNSKLELLKKLRSLTSIGYQNCKEALENTDYNLDLAIE